MPEVSGTSQYLRHGIFEFIERLQHLFGPGANGYIVGQIYPPNGAGGINEKFSRPSDVGSLWSCSTMEKVVASNDLRFSVGKQGVSEAELLGMALTDLRRVDTNPNNAEATHLEIGKPVLKTPQLGVTERSPKPAVENQYRARRSWR